MTTHPKANPEVLALLTLIQSRFDGFDVGWAVAITEDQVTVIPDNAIPQELIISDADLDGQDVVDNAIRATDVPAIFVVTDLTTKSKPSKSRSTPVKRPNPPYYTAEEWFKSWLGHGWQQAALREIGTDDFEEPPKFYNLAAAIRGSFDFDTTLEGSDAWLKLLAAIETDRPLPVYPFNRLTREDFPVGCYIRSKGSDDWMCVCMVDDKGVHTKTHVLDPKELSVGWEICYPPEMKWRDL